MHDIDFSAEQDDIPLSYKLALDLDLTLTAKSHGVCPIDDIHDNEIWEESQNTLQTEENPFLLGLAIDIPEVEQEIFPEIESCDDEEDEYSDCDPVSPDIDAEIDLDRKFPMRKYQYIENIGIGAYGIVDKVMHCRRQQYVAIKVCWIFAYNMSSNRDCN